MEEQEPQQPPITRVWFDHAKYGKITNVGVVSGFGVVGNKDYTFKPAITQVIVAIILL